jgi:hypothetical protein
MFGDELRLLKPGSKQQLIGKIELK